MKRLTNLATLLIFALFCSCQQQPAPDPNAAKPALDEAAETAAIMQVIDNETKCFFDGNYECWAKNWSHQPYALQAWNNSDGTADAAVGWEKINAQGKGWIEDIYENGENVVHPVFKRDKPQVKFYGDNMAYLIWTQYNADGQKTLYRVSRETRIMEKEADGWKIVNVSAFWGVEKPIAFDSLQIN
ncbi:MAG: hypothetical protein IPN76_21760 [Saprospiraceae bacterium]|nr:hypothetical protein [Saprospiraceae bacterium]